MSSGYNDDLEDIDSIDELDTELDDLDFSSIDDEEDNEVEIELDDEGEEDDIELDKKERSNNKGLTNDALDSIDDFDDLNEFENLDTETIENNVDLEYKNENIDNGMYTEGTPVDSKMLLDDVEEDESNDIQTGFISKTGDLVVMENTDNEDGFELIYVDIANIAIVHRIRQGKSVNDLMRSIKSTGLISPITVGPTATNNIFVLLDGFRRLTACAQLGKRRIPCIVNNKVSTPEIPILEAMYNHTKSYSIKETIDYIDYLEKEKGIMSASMIEYLLQLNSGDYTKLKDIINDNDDDIVTKLYDGIYTIEMAFKKLEQRRKKESAEEKDNRKAAAVYDNEEKSGASEIAGSGEEADGECELTDEEIKALAINVKDLDEDIEDASLDEMVQQGKEIEGFGTKKQDVENREFTDPTVRKAVFVRDKYTCQCCKEGGESYIDVLEAHHVLPVFLNKGVSADIGGDCEDNLITLCIKCHRQVHLYSTKELSIPKEKTAEELASLSEDEKVIYHAEQMKFKRIVKLGTSIRKGMEQKGIKLDKYKKEHSSKDVGRHLPGYRNGISTSEVKAVTEEGSKNE